MNLLITVNYNNAKLTNEMIEQINKCKDSNCKIIVVDNASKDVNSLKEYDNLEILKLKKNIGYFPAINYALARCYSNEYENVIICNNDLIFQDNFFSILKKSNYANDIFAISPKIVDMDGIDQNPVLEKSISRIKIFCYDIYFINYFLGAVIFDFWQKIKKHTKKTENVSRTILLGYGAIYILRKSFFQFNDLLSTPPFLMGEEAFLSDQIKRNNGKIYFDANLNIQHKEHSSCKLIQKKEMYDITKQSYKIYRNKLLNLGRK